jgi:hypothetical protein
MSSSWGLLFIILETSRWSSCHQVSEDSGSAVGWVVALELELVNPAQPSLWGSPLAFGGTEWMTPTSLSTRASPHLP